MHDLDAGERDSLLAQYDDEVHFQLTIRPREGKAAGDVAFDGVQSEVDFDARVRQLNFELGQYFELRVGEEVLLPVLAHFENTYGLTEYRRVQLVFPRPETVGNWAVVFEDGVWWFWVWNTIIYAF